MKNQDTSPCLLLTYDNSETIYFILDNGNYFGKLSSIDNEMLDVNWQVHDSDWIL